MIESQGVCLKYLDETVAVKDFNIHISQGEVVYITGPSGSGKTSILKLLMGIEYPTNGHLSVLGQPIKKDESSKIRKMRRIIGPVFQDFRLLKGRTVFDNVLLGMRFLDLKLNQMKVDADEAITKVGLSHKKNSIIDNLSWGECQRAAIARAIARKPRLIIADEPTGNLDKDNALNILELLTSFKNNKTTVIITTHATHLIEDIDEGMLIRMDTGNIQWERIKSEKCHA